MSFFDPPHGTAGSGPTSTRVEAPRIAYVLKMFPRLSETFVLNEILELEQQGVPVRIFSLKPPTDQVTQAETDQVRSHVTYLPERIWKEPLRILRAQFGVFRRYPYSYLRALVRAIEGRRLRSLGRPMRKFWQACCLIHEMAGIQHLHAHFATSPFQVTFLAHKIARIPYSITTHAKDLYRDARVGAPGLRRKLSLARFIVANSEYSASHLRANLNGQTQPSVYTIYNGIDLSAFPQRLQDPAAATILSVGRLVEKKGFTHLIEACRLLKERGIRFHCEIVGTGPLERSLQSLIKNSRLEGHVTLLGPLPQRELRQHYLQAMVFVLPCVVAADGDRDILPNVLKEAMAVGVPVVTTRLPGIEELVEHGTSGLLVPPSDTKVLATTLERLLADSSLRQSLATRARKVVEERFDRKASIVRLKFLLLEAFRGLSMERMGAVGNNGWEA